MPREIIACPICSTVGKRNTFCKTCQWFLIGALDAISLTPIPESELDEINASLQAYCAGWKDRTIQISEGPDQRELAEKLEQANSEITTWKEHCLQLEQAQQLQESNKVELVRQLEQANSEITLWKERCLQLEYAQQDQASDQSELVQKLEQSNREFTKMLEQANQEIFVWKERCLQLEHAKQDIQSAPTRSAQNPPKETTLSSFNIQGQTLVRFIGQESNVVVPTGIKVIGPRAFSDRRGITSITLLSSVKEIAAGAFSQCSDLKEVNLPNSLASIGAQAFMGCENLTAIAIPSRITRIHARTFFGCKSLKTLNIPNSVTQIDENAFTASGIFSWPAKVSLPEGCQISDLSQGAKWMARR